MRRSREHPVLITSAKESKEVEYDRRRKRYAIMMFLRAVFIVAAALVYHVSAILALAFVVGGMVLPWSAVLIANDRPAKKRASRKPGPGANRERALPGSTEDRIVDG